MEEKEDALSAVDDGGGAGLSGSDATLRLRVGVEEVDSSPEVECAAESEGEGEDARADVAATAAPPRLCHTRSTAPTRAISSLRRTSSPSVSTVSVRIPYRLPSATT